MGLSKSCKNGNLHAVGTIVMLNTGRYAGMQGRVMGYDRRAVGTPYEELNSYYLVRDEKGMNRKWGVKSVLKVERK